MASKRLTKQMKSDIVEAIARSSYLKVIEEKEKELLSLGYEVYKAGMSNYKEIIDSLPEELFTKRSSFSVCIDPKLETEIKFREDFNSAYVKSVDIKLSRPEVIHSAGAYCNTFRSFICGKRNHQVNRYISAKEALDKLYADRSLLVKKSKSIVDQCTTISSLLRAWPEVEEFIPEHIKAVDQIKAIAIRTDEVNGLIKSAQCLKAA